MLVRILAARALMDKPNLSEIGTFGYRQFEPKPNDFGPNCSKFKQFTFVQNPNLFRISNNWALKVILSEIRTILSHLFLWMFRFRTEIYVRNQNFFVWILDAVQIPNHLELGQKLTSENQTSSDFGIPLYRCLK